MSQKALIAAITSGLFTMLAVVLWPIASAKAEAEIVNDDFKIKSSAPGIELFVRNKRPAGTDVSRGDRTVLYVHGATLASELVFDLPVGGASWADDLARAGWDVWLVDVRGYGRSTWPEALRAPAESNPPVATTAEAVADFTSAADFIRAKRKIDSLQVIGWSWGGVISGAYAAANPDKVSSLVLVAPLWAFDKPVTAGPPKKAWQEWTLADSRADPKGRSSGTGEVDPARQHRRAVGEGHARQPAGGCGTHARTVQVADRRCGGRVVAGAAAL